MMAVSFSCKCSERKKPLKERNWFIIHRHHNHSAFEYPKNAAHYSDYSTVWCKTCNALGRTKAEYVDELRDVKRNEFYK